MGVGAAHEYGDSTSLRLAVLPAGDVEPPPCAALVAEKAERSIFAERDFFAQRGRIPALQPAIRDFSQQEFRGAL